MSEHNIEVGDAFLLRVRPGAALTPNGYNESSTWSVADRIVACVVQVEDDLVALECSDPSYHNVAGARVLHRQVLEIGDGFLVEPPLPQAHVGCALSACPLHPNRK